MKTKHMQNLTVEQAIEVKKLFVGGFHLNFNLPHSEIFLPLKAVYGTFVINSV